MHAGPILIGAPVWAGNPVGEGVHHPVKRRGAA
jgi:hypothetical protein